MYRKCCRDVPAADERAKSCPLSVCLAAAAVCYVKNAFLVEEKKEGAIQGFRNDLYARIIISRTLHRDNFNSFTLFP